MIKFNPNLVE